jgi:hypothetical protein
MPFRGERIQFDHGELKMLGARCGVFVAIAKARIIEDSSGS